MIKCLLQIIWISVAGIVCIPTVNASDERTAGGLVSKTVTSSKMRLVLMAGLEGAGHHYLHRAVDVMFSAHAELTRLVECHMVPAYYIVDAMATSPLHYAEMVDQARIQMRNLALEEQRLPSPGTVATLVLEGVCRPGTVGQLSFPNFAGPNKVFQHIDVRMLAEVAEAEGVDLRIVYLQRSARGLLLSNTDHRGFEE